MKRFILPALITLCCPTLIFATNTVGVIISTKGQVLVNGKPAKRGTRIKTNQLIRTASAAKAQIRFTDGALISLQPKTRFKVEKYQYRKQERDNENVSRLLQGGLRVLSGNISKENPNGYKLKTKLAQMTVRGTAFSIGQENIPVRVCNAAGDCQTQLRESLFVHTETGQVEMQPLDLNNGTEQQAMRGQFLGLIQGGQGSQGNNLASVMRRAAHSVNGEVRLQQPTQQRFNRLFFGGLAANNQNEPAQTRRQDHFQSNSPLTQNTDNANQENNEQGFENTVNPNLVSNENNLPSNHDTSIIDPFVGFAIEQTGLPNFALFGQTAENDLLQGPNSSMIFDTQIPLDRNSAFFTDFNQLKLTNKAFGQLPSGINMGNWTNNLGGTPWPQGPFGTGPSAASAPGPVFWVTGIKTPTMDIPINGTYTLDTTAGIGAIAGASNLNGALTSGSGQIAIQYNPTSQTGTFGGQLHFRDALKVYEFNLTGQLQKNLAHQFTNVQAGICNSAGSNSVCNGNFVHNADQMKIDLAIGAHKAQNHNAAIGSFDVTNTGSGEGASGVFAMPCSNCTFQP